MIRKIIEVENNLGLHARAAAKLVHMSSRFSSAIYLSREGYQQEIDCKSILGVLMLGASKGTRLVVSISGADEDEASNAIVRLFAGRFGEEL
ncbi:MAG: HPr family phosphocarrier protein [Acidobacteriota bacterium]|jgi:phosphocarrier protein